MKLNPPFIITARLAPGLKIGDVFLSFADGRFVFDFPDGSEHIETANQPTKTRMKTHTMTIKQKNSYRRFLRAARKAGAVKYQKGYHGCGKWSAQGHNESGNCVIDWNL